MGNIADYMTPVDICELEPHWTEKHITKETRYVAWDESGANKLGYFKTKGQAQQALIKYAKTLNKTPKRS